MKALTFKKNNPMYWAYLTVGILAIIFAVIFAPIWTKVEWAFWKSWGQTIINLMIAIVLSLYLFGFLLKKIKKTTGATLKTLTIIEFVLLFLIDVYLILGQWIPQLNIIPVNGACAITGLALWCRGTVEIFRAYFHQRDNKTPYPIWWLCFAIAFISLGMWMMVSPFIKDVVLLWIIVCFFLVAGILLVVYGIVAQPKVEKKPSKTKK
jgi:uncharacterized membrane protein HdeD (DUF308 family)